MVRCTVYLLFIVASGGPAGRALSGDASRGALSVGRVGGKVNVLLRGCADVEGGRVDQLRSHANVALADQDPGVVNGLGEALLVDLGLETPLQQFLGGQLQDLIQFEFVVGEKTVAVHAAQQGRAFEDALGVIGLEGEQGSGGLAEFRQRVLHPPDFTLTAQSVFTDQLQLGVQALLLVRTAGRLEGLAVCGIERKRTRW